MQPTPGFPGDPRDRRDPGRLMRGERSLISGRSLEVEVLPLAGARLHRIRAFGHEMLRTPDEVELHHHEPFAWGGYVMAPWCNRLETTPTAVGDRIVRLDANSVDGSAIHGQVYDRPWDETGPGKFRARGGGDGWPWRYEATLEASVNGRRLGIELALTNLDDAAMPAGIGWHPWFVGPVEVRIPAGSVYRSNVASPPQPDPVLGPYDRRELGPLAPDLDATWTDLDGDAVELLWPAAAISGALRARAGLHGPGQRRDEDGAVGLCIVAANLDLGAVAIEPQTHAPQGLRRLLAGEPDAMRFLEPGATLRLEIELTFKRA